MYLVYYVDTIHCTIDPCKVQVFTPPPWKLCNIYVGIQPPLVSRVGFPHHPDAFPDFRDHGTVVHSAPEDAATATIPIS